MPPDRPRPSPAPNRVQPSGPIVAVPARGTWMGNRGGRLHGVGDRRYSIVRPYSSRAWLVCRLSFRDRRVRQWDPHRYTPLFFADEAVAFAAGHRPCGECRYRSFVAFRDAFPGTVEYAREMDVVLHAERWDASNRRHWLHTLPWRELPDGTFVVTGDRPALILGDSLVEWDATRYAYGVRRARPPRGDATVLTPPATVGVLHAGYPVHIASPE